VALTSGASSQNCRARFQGDRIASCELFVRGGTVANAHDVVRCDVGISRGPIVALGHDLARGDEESMPTGLVVLPGGVDGHCHIEQNVGKGAVAADEDGSGRRVSSMLLPSKA